MHRSRRTSRHDQTAIRFAHECSDVPLDLAAVAQSIGINSTPNDGGAMASIAANWPIPPLARIAKDRNSRQVGRNLFE